MGARLEGVLERRGVTAYLCGHEHNLQHLVAPGKHTHHLISGGGSRADYRIIAQHAADDMRWYHDGSGV